MSAAKLSAALLAPKGAARPLANIYDNPMQKPITLGFDPARYRAKGPQSGPRARPSPSEETVKLSLRLGRDDHRKFKILAARRGVSLQAVLVEALADHLTGQDHDCHCMRAGKASHADCRCRH